ncbi:transport and Golgi organization protein 1 isoform X2 [Leptopilina heterotoma]|uniref:transport and Golgi organization protein 1 isoform X2 n=1 Tax=Leptopilina heterotoma TaxID=63436 RepID=UPI001CA99C95|nr:transport and Golgi organization protein 1 isoform X2 [Leptopilina heterotoma]
MTKITPFMILILSLIIYTINQIPSCSAIISDKRLCHDEKCSEPVSLAKTLLKYNSNDEDILSFQANTEVKVYSKSAGNRPDLWGVEILGKRGYAPMKMIREYTVMKSVLKFEVPTKPIEDIPKNEIEKENDEPTEKSPEISVINSSAKDLEHLIPVPENVSPSYEVIDGTTIPLAIDDSTNDYSSSQSIEDVATEEEPILSVHPSLVSSTISFVTQVIDKVTQQLEKVESMNINENDEKEEENIPLTENENISQTEDENIPPIEGKINEETEAEGKNEEEENIPLNENKNVSQTEDENIPSIEDKINDETETKEKIEEKELKEEEKEKEIVQEPEKTLPDETVSDESVNDEESEENESKELEEEEKNKTEDEIKKQEEKEINEEVKTQGEEEKEKSEIKEESETKEEIKEEGDKNEEEDKNERIEEGAKEVQETEEKEENETIENIHPPEQQIPIEEKFPTATETETKDSKIIENYESKFTNDSPMEKEIPLPDLITETTTATNQVPLIDERETLILNDENNNNNINNSQIDDNANMKNEESESKTNQNSKLGFDIFSLHKLKSVENVNNVNSENILLENTSTDINFDFNREEMKINETGDISDEINNDVSNDDNNNNYSSANNDTDIYMNEEFVYNNDSSVISSKNDPLDSLEPHFHDDVEPRKEILSAEQASTFNELPSNRNLLNFDETSHFHSQESQSDKLLGNDISESAENLAVFNKQDSVEEAPIPMVLPPDVCEKDSNCQTENVVHNDDISIANVINMGKNYWEFLTYLLITSITILVFSLGYYYIENARRDNQLIGRINKLEKELMVSSKECAMLNENLTCTKTKLNSIEDESFGSNEMVASLKADLEAAQNTNLEMEDQVVTLEKELESATEAGLELERMLRELLSSNKEDNPLAQSVEDLQARLNAQQAENEALTNALNLKKQELEFDRLESDGLSSDLLSFTKKYEELEIEVKRLEEELKTQGNMKIYMEQSMEDKIQRLEFQMRETMEERSQMRQALKAKELEVNHLLEVVDQENSNNLDFDKLYDSVQAKAEALQLAEERYELRVQLVEAENNHKSLEAHVKSAKEEVLSLTEECKAFEKEKKDAETKLEVLTNFFNEKEAQRQKEEAVWLEKQGEVSSTVERIHTMQNEIQNYKQQIEILKREIVDQEREYKSQIGALETKAHEHWVVARQNERRLEELKAESGQLRNRLTIVEKSMNDPDPEVKLHRMEANGESATSPSLFLGPDNSSSPIMFSNTSGVPPPPPPSYMFGPGFHPYLPPPPPGPGGLPPFDVGQRPPPLGGRLSSPPPLPLQPPSGRYENTGSPPPLSPPLPPHHHLHHHHHHPSHHFGRHRSPPSPHFTNDHHIIHPPPPPPPSLLPIPPLNHSHNWGVEESLPRNSGFYSRDQRSRNHKGSLHSSGESLDKSHHSGKV